MFYVYFITSCVEIIIGRCNCNGSNHSDRSSVANHYYRLCRIFRADKCIRCNAGGKSVVMLFACPYVCGLTGMLLIGFVGRWFVRV